MINQQIDFSKKAKISKGIKVLLPAGLFFGGGGYGAFYLTKQLQSSDQALSTSHLANFDNFHSLFSPNSYSS